MPQPYLKPVIEIDIFHAYGTGFREDSFLQSGTTHNWNAPDAGVTATTDGDVLNLSGTTATNGFSRGPGIALASGTTNKIALRAKAGTIATGSTIDFRITFTDATTQTITITLGLNYAVTTTNLTASKTVDSLKWLNQSAAGTAFIDLAIMTNKSIVLTSQDDAVGPDTTASTTAVNEASFRLKNDGAKYTAGSFKLDFYDDVYIYEGYLRDDLQIRKLSKVFGGSIMELDPSLDTAGDLLQVQCSGWAQALLNALVAKDYGSGSDNPSITTFQATINDIVNSFVNPDGYQLSTTYIQNIAGPPAITYMLFKNDQAFDAIKQSIDLLTAGDPTNATTYPAEFWVDNSENCHLAPLGAWGSDPNPSTYPNTLSVGSEHILNNFRKDILNLKNKVHFITAYINPSNRDSFTEGNASSWSFSSNGVGGSSTVSNDSTAGNFKVGSQSIKANWSGMSPAPTTVALNYPSAANLALDITKLGGKITPARIIFFVKCDQAVFFPQLQCVTTAPNAVFTGPSMPDVNGVNTSDWHRFEVFFGPYGDNFVPGPSANWTNINQFQFLFSFNAPGPAGGNIWVDGVYIEGQNHFVATNSTRQNQYGTRETSLTSAKHRNATTQQALAKAELIRLDNPILRGTIQVPGIPAILPGQKVTINAPSANLSNATLRVLTVKHHYGQDNFTTTLELTDDLTNYQALKVTSMADLLLQIHTPSSKPQRQKDIEMGNPLTLSGQPDFTTTAQIRDYPG